MIMRKTRYLMNKTPSKLPKGQQVIIYTSVLHEKCYITSRQANACELNLCSDYTIINGSFRWQIYLIAPALKLYPPF